MYNRTMSYYEVSPIGIVSQDFFKLTYSFSDTLKIGQVVQIPVGNKNRNGVVISKIDKPAFDTKSITKVLFDTPLPVHFLALHEWISQFYMTHPGIVWQTILPSGLDKKRRNTAVKSTSLLNNSIKSRTNIVFTSDQLHAIDTIVKSGPITSILHGVTGSGKTEVYKALVLEARIRRKSAIILVPEISLTAQLVNNFKSDFDNVIVTHSAMTESERAATWQKVLHSKDPITVIGPRSALFMPVQNLGLIVIDECHEPSYTQEKSPRYNALRVASFLTRITKSRLILGSATPLIADYFTAEKLNKPIIKMKQLAVSGAKQPIVKVIDLTKSANRSSESRLFSRQLLDAMKSAIQSKRQVLLFHNRRGTASVTLCENCGWMAQCPRCFLPMTLHADRHLLRCHICAYTEKIPTACPICNHADIIHRGIGTKRIEEEIRRLFPNSEIRRFDGDTERGQAVQDIYDQLRSGVVDFIIGTQTIAKGLDLPNLAVVGIIQADAGLSLPDFSASERTFELISQATGRVGRNANDSTAIIQTYQPDSPAVKFGSNQDYDGFYDHEIKHRFAGHFPPFAHLMKLTCVYKTERGAINAARKLANEIHSSVQDGVKILGPTPAFYERAAGSYRWQIVVRSSDRKLLLKIAKKVPPTKWQVELDPISLL